MAYKTDIEIARECEKKHILEIARIAGVDEKYLEPYGSYKAKVDNQLLRDMADRPNGKLILVTAITPTPAGALPFILFLLLLLLFLFLFIQFLIYVS